MIGSTLFKEIRLLLGIPTLTPTLKEICASLITAFIATICVIYFAKLVSNYLNVTNDVYILTSIAATTVLVFAVPHGALSQPWQVILGHAVSACVGVTCYKIFNDSVMLAAALAVALSIVAMLLMKCIHPPGGATALAAVLGGESIHQLGYSYILIPTLLNAFIVVIAAIILNYPFSWRRYPSHLFYRNNSAATISPGERKNEITTEDFLKSVHEHSSFIDITDEGWINIFENAKKHAEIDDVHPVIIESGFAYSNGKIGKEWEIRYVETITKSGMVKYSTHAGIKIGLEDQCHISNFLAWSKFKANKNMNGTWERTHLA